MNLLLAQAVSIYQFKPKHVSRSVPDGRSLDVFLLRRIGFPFSLPLLESPQPHLTIWSRVDAKLQNILFTFWHFLTSVFFSPGSRHLHHPAGCKVAKLRNFNWRTFRWLSSTLLRFQPQTLPLRRTPKTWWHIWHGVTKEVTSSFPIRSLCSFHFSFRFSPLARFAFLKHAESTTFRQPSEHHLHSFTNM